MLRCSMMRQFFKLESASGILLLVAAALAMILANSAANPLYQWIIHTPLELPASTFATNRALLWWINEGLMVLFFLLIGLEVKRELLVGSLATRAQAVFPVIAAVGGMVLPALIYLGFNNADSVARTGWAIPVSTDIAFSLGVLALLGSRVPSSLKVFLLALAIVDDLGVIVIISLFHTKQVSLSALCVVLLVIGLLAMINLRGVANVTAYLLLGILLWMGLLKSGFHATLAGVIVGFSIPSSRSPQLAISCAAQRLERWLHPWVSYLVLPLFAFANAGVTLAGLFYEEMLTALPLSIVAGLLVGKPLGICSFSWLAIRMGWAKLPTGVQFRNIFAVAVLCGIGFTMAIFIATCAFESVEANYGLYARLAILIGSTIAAVVGYGLLTIQFPKVGALRKS